MPGRGLNEAHLLAVAVSVQQREKFQAGAEVARVLVVPGLGLEPVDRWDTGERGVSELYG